MSDTERGHALRWECPECGARVTGMAESLEAAEGALLAAVREHCGLHGRPIPNEHAAASWLAPAGHLVELWGGPFDGDRLWCPPGELPDVIGAHRTADGAVVPIRSAVARLLPHVETYRRGDPAAAAAAGRRLRYLHDGRHR